MKFLASISFLSKIIIKYFFRICYEKVCESTYFGIIKIKLDYHFFDNKKYFISSDKIKNNFSLIYLNILILKIV